MANVTKNSSGEAALKGEFHTVGGIVDRPVLAAAKKPAEHAPVAKFPTVDEKERLLRKPWTTEMLPRHRQLIEDALEIEQEEARAAGALGYMARTLAQATLPHTDPKLPAGTLYSRDTGRLTLSVAPTSRRHGIPYGSIPRVILAWICSEAVKTKERTLSISGKPQTAQQRPRHCPLSRASFAPVQVGYFRGVHRRARRRLVFSFAHFRIVACVLAPKSKRAARPLGEFARAVRRLLSGSHGRARAD
jgi:hypothetical protein